ncbi:MAG: hypothetical protein Kow0077_24290 [Anaerolineae bacterium]
MTYDISRDLYILQAMVEPFEAYLISNELFWPLYGNLREGMPRLTIGGYLLRRHRLTALRDLMDADQQSALDAALATLEGIKAEWTLHYFQKLEQDWHMRLHLLQEFLRDCQEIHRGDCFESWPPHAEHRTVAHHLLAEWQDHTSDLKTQKAELHRIDNGLRQHLLSGETGHFLWSAALQPAYPRETFWWLWVVPSEDNEEPSA